MSQDSKVKWFEWSKEVFDKAKKENKPVLLDIFGTWCHWCHVMKGTYESEDVAKIINEKFVPVRVDTDKRPDINERYNQGGWPTTAFLTPDGTLIAGTTYVPPQRMPALLREVEDFYRKNYHAIKASEELHKAESFSGKEITEEIISDVLDELLANYDADYGGFGYEPKFPMPEAIELLLLRFEKTKDKSLLRMAEKTLEGMLGLFDQQEGGFFRYSVSADWRKPHYEKMLEVNAKLLRSYLIAYKLTGKEKYKEIAEKTISFLLDVLSNGKSFYGSQDADGELAYYGKSKEERKKLQKPFIDKNVYTDLNCLAINAFLDAAEILKRDDYRNLALRVLEFLVSNCYSEEKGAAHYYDAENKAAQNFGLLNDNASLMSSLARAYELTGKDYLKHAEDIANFLLSNMQDEKGFFDKISRIEDIGYLKTRRKSLMGNALAAEAFLDLFHVTKNEEYKKAAKDALEEFSLRYKNFGLHAAGYALAVERFLE